MSDIYFLVCFAFTATVFFTVLKQSKGTGIVRKLPILTVRVKENRDVPDLETVTEEIHANITEDTVSIEFVTPDQTHVLGISDFRKEVQLLKLTVFGEEERGDPAVQHFCFGIYHPTMELLSPSSVTRLRQKNPESVKWAEEEKSTEQRYFQMALSTELASKLLTPYVDKLCTKSSIGVLLSESDYDQLRSSPDSNGDDDLQSNDVQKLLSDSSLPSCKAVSSTRKACLCQLSLCVPWYPCGWKLCRGKNHAEDDQMGPTVKCGIKSCRMCYSLNFQIHEKLQCMWDEE